MSGFKQTFGYFAVFSVVLTTIIFYHILNFPQQYMGDKSLENQTKSKSSEEAFETEEPCLLNESWSQGQMIYNMVPKCGSLGFRQLIYRLHGRNKFTAAERKYNDQHFTMPYHLSLSGINHTIETQLKILQKPWIYFGHLHFIDVQEYEANLTPTYINIVRDPIERLISMYYYMRRGGKLRYKRPLGKLFAKTQTRLIPRLNMTFEECVLNGDIECSDPRFLFQIIPHFCGQEEFCISPSQKALDQAKANANKHFALIGYLEKCYQFFELLEYLFPRYFRDLMEVHKVQLRTVGETNKGKNKGTVSHRARNILTRREDIKLEYEFYEFVKEKFDSQYEKYVRCNTKV